MGSSLVSGWMEKPATWLSHSQRGDSLPRDPAAGLSPGRFSAAAASLFPGGREAAGALEPVGCLCPARGGQSGPTQLTPPSPHGEAAAGASLWPGPGVLRGERSRPLCCLRPGPLQPPGASSSAGSFAQPLPGLFRLQVYTCRVGRAMAGRHAGSVSRGRWRPPPAPWPGRLFSLRPLGAPRWGCSAAGLLRPLLPRLPRPRMDLPAASTPHPNQPTPV